MFTCIVEVQTERRWLSHESSHNDYYACDRKLDTMTDGGVNERSSLVHPAVLSMPPRSGLRERFNLSGREQAVIAGPKTFTSLRIRRVSFSKTKKLTASIRSIHMGSCCSIQVGY